MSKCLYIPRTVNKDYVFIWKKDEAAFLMLPWIFFFMIGGVTGFSLTLILTIIVSHILKALGNDKPEGYMFHYIKYKFPKEFIARVFIKNPDLNPKRSLFLKKETFPGSHIRHIAG